MKHGLQNALAALAITLATQSRAQPAPTDPDWPCPQLLVPELSAGAYWSGPAAPPANWRNDQALFALVTNAVDRDTPEAEAATKLAAYDPDPAKRAALFGALVDETNDERTDIIRRIEKLAHRQRGLGDTIAQLSAQAEASSKNSDQAGQRDLAIHAFQETQRTMRYACEVPAAMERRLGIFARALQTTTK